MFHQLLDILISEEDPTYFRLQRLCVISIIGCTYTFFEELPEKYRRVVEEAWHYWSSTRPIFLAAGHPWRDAGNILLKLNPNFFSEDKTISSFLPFITLRKDFVKYLKDFDDPDSNNFLLAFFINNTNIASASHTGKLEDKWKKLLNYKQYFLRFRSYVNFLFDSYNFNIDFLMSIFEDIENCFYHYENVKVKDMRDLNYIAAKIARFIYLNHIYYRLYHYIYWSAPFHYKYYHIYQPENEILNHTLILSSNIVHLFLDKNYNETPEYIFLRQIFNYILNGKIDIEKINYGMKNINNDQIFLFLYLFNICKYEKKLRNIFKPFLTDLYHDYKTYHAKALYITSIGNLYQKFKLPEKLYDYLYNEIEHSFTKKDKYMFLIVFEALKLTHSVEAIKSFFEKYINDFIQWIFGYVFDSSEINYILRMINDIIYQPEITRIFVPFFKIFLEHTNDRARFSFNRIETLQICKNCYYYIDMNEKKDLIDSLMKLLLDSHFEVQITAVDSLLELPFKKELIIEKVRELKERAKGSNIDTFIVHLLEYKTLLRC